MRFECAWEERINIFCVLGGALALFTDDDDDDDDWAGRAREERSKINFLNLYRQPDITLTKSINAGRACDGLFGGPAVRRS